MGILSFISLNFWVAFPVIFLLYWLIPHKLPVLRKCWLILISYMLYMTWKPAFALVLLYVTAVTFIGALSFKRARSRRKALACLFLLLSLAPLLVFKYYNFLNNSVTAGLDAVGLHFALPGLNWAVPIGISFFTFQAVAYMLDVYRGQIEPERNPIDYLLFVSFFPQIVCGPISKGSELLPQIRQPAPFSYEQGKQGLKFLLWGMFIKIVIADRLGLFVDTVYSNYYAHNGTTLLLTTFFYSIQIYCDFAGYSLMAIGLAKTLGFNLINNFRRPYFAVSITDFWRRWHISLTRWLKENIYIPLGGSRCSKARCYFNILITFLVSGIWHGAAWTFVLWGVLHGFIQIFEKMAGVTGYEGHNPLVRGFRMLVTFLIVSFAWILFRSPDISTAFTIIGTIFTSAGVPAVSEMGGAVILILVLALSILIFKELREEFFPGKVRFLDSGVFRGFAYISLFCMIIMFGVLDGGQFIYASF